MLTIFNNFLNYNFFHENIRNSLDTSLDINLSSETRAIAVFSIPREI